MFHVSDGTCGGYRQGIWTAPTRCPARPVAAGLRLITAPKTSVWWVFACNEHVEYLRAARPLLDRDHAEIAHRRAAAPQERTRPLAVGRAARELVARAERWAAAHPEHGYTPPPGPPASAPEAAQRTAAAHPFAAYASDAPTDSDGPSHDRGEQPHP